MGFALSPTCDFARFRAKVYVSSMPAGLQFRSRISRTLRRLRPARQPPSPLCERWIAPSILLDVGLLDDVVDLRLGEDISHCGLLEQPANLAEPIVGVEAQVEDRGAGCVFTRLVRARRRLPFTPFTIGMIRGLFAAVWSIVQIWSSLSGCLNRGAGEQVAAGSYGVSFECVG